VFEEALLYTAAMKRSYPTPRLSRRVSGAALHALWWTLPVGLMAISRAMSGEAQTWFGIVLFWVLWVFLGTTICSGLTLLANRLEVLSWRPARQVLAGAAGALVGTFTFCVVPVPFVLATSSEPDTGKSLVWVVLIVLLTFLAWVPAAMLVGQLQRIGMAEREALRARALATETELRAMRQQVNSHLVFNALNSILVAVEEGSAKAASMVLDLSSLLRQSLETLPHMGTLGDELARLDLYARIEKSRFEDDLRVNLEVAEGLRELPCLPLVLQPLVENAIKHGFARATPPLCISLRAEHRDGRLTVRVTNDGLLHLGDEAASEDTERGTSGGGLGLRATRHRLQQEYGAAAGLELSQSTHAGERRVTATISWPVPAGVA
jgi:two-component sensor histidine kinase